MRIDANKYQSTGEYYSAIRKAGYGVPLQMMQGIDIAMKRLGLSFSEAVRYLARKKVILFCQ